MTINALHTAKFSFCMAKQKFFLYLKKETAISETAVSELCVSAD
jgi:hypothetical protein